MDINRGKLPLLFLYKVKVLGLAYAFFRCPSRPFPRSGKWRREDSLRTVGSRPSFVRCNQSRIELQSSRQGSTERSQKSGGANPPDLISIHSAARGGYDEVLNVVFSRNPQSSSLLSENVLSRNALIAAVNGDHESTVAFVAGQGS